MKNHTDHINHLLDELRKHEIQLELKEDGNLKIHFSPDKVVPPTLLSELKKSKSQVSDYLKSYQSVSNIPPAPKQESYVLSNAQQRIWMAAQVEDGLIAYNLPSLQVIDFPINEALFKDAIRSIISRHEILRTVFLENDVGETRQWIKQAETFEFNLTILDFSQEQDPETIAAQYAEKDAYIPFDLEHGPLFRISLLKVHDDRYMLYNNMHHIITDAWSTDLLKRDLMVFYHALVSGSAPELPVLEIQYKDFAHWQAHKLKEGALDTHRDFWLAQLDGELGRIDLPSSKTRPHLKTFDGFRIVKHLRSSLKKQLGTFCQKEGGSNFMGLLAAWKVLLYRYTGQTDLIIGSPIAGRDHADLTDQIGFYVNTLALRTHIDPEEAFLSFFQKVKETCLSSYSHQSYPFDQLSDELNLAQPPGRNPIFDISFSHQSLVDLRSDENFGLDKIHSGTCRPKFDMDVEVLEFADQFSIVIEFNTDVYEVEMIEQLFAHYEELLLNLIQAPSSSVSQINFLSDEETYLQQIQFNATSAEYPLDQNFMQLFDSQVASAPHNLALNYHGRKWTYEDLSSETRALASHLIKDHGTQIGDRVGICLDRSADYIIAVIGVLSAGATYVPIDPSYPEERINYMLKDSQSKVCINNDFMSTYLAYREATDAENWSPIDVASSNVAYIVYTSGSSGKPKGVMVTHSNLLNLCHWHQRVYELVPESRGTLYSGIGFDASVWEIFPYLMSGASLFPIEEELRYDMSALEKFLINNRISHIYLPTQICQNLVSLDTQLDDLVVLTGGDRLQLNQKPKFQIYNNYGPSENTVVATYHKVGTDWSQPIPIGKPISNTKVYVLNDGLALQPLGAVGELCLSGASLSAGYCGLESQTSASFVPNPFAEGELLYRTGDLARWNNAGELEFIGRKDDQVKIRGFRIEPGEITYHIRQMSSIKDGVCVPIAWEDGEKVLVGYIIPEDGWNGDALSDALSEHLPDYMIPHYWIPLDSVPLTSNGKLDRKALPHPNQSEKSEKFVAASTPLEHLVIETLEEVLNKKGLSLSDNFFHIGGDSIKSIQVVSKLKQKGYSIKVGDILRTSHLLELVSQLATSVKQVEQSEIVGEVPLTPIQANFFEWDLPNVHHFNQSVLLKSNDPIEEHSLRKSLDHLVSHHDALRMRYIRQGNNWVQHCLSTDQDHFTLEYHDLRGQGEADLLIEEIGDEMQECLDLEHGPLFKVCIIRLSDNYRLGLVLHHLVSDGISWRILLEDLSTLYHQNISGKEPKLPLKTDAYLTWSNELRNYAPIRSSAADYWNAQATVDLPLLPIDKGNYETTATLDGLCHFSLSPEKTELLQTVIHRVYHTQINDVLLTALGIALEEVFEAKKYVIILEGHGRQEILEHVDVTRTVGWFTSIYPFVMDSASEDIESSLIDIKEGLRKIPNNGVDYGILKFLGNEEGLDIQGKIEFNYLGDFGSGVKTASDKDRLFDYAAENFGLEVSKANKRPVFISVAGMVVNEKLTMTINYSEIHYQEETIRNLTECFQASLEQLIESLSQTDRTPRLTPSDLTFKSLRIDELEVLEAYNLEDVYPLSPLQMGMYYHWLSAPENSIYHQQTAYRIKSQKLNSEYLSKAYDQLVQRHAVLRTSFHNEYGGIPLQIVHKQVPTRFRFVTNPTLDGKDAETWVQNQIELDRNQPFSLLEPGQMRLTVLEVTPGTYEFVWTHHHILMDGWCVSILVNEFYQLLSAATTNIKIALPELRPYSDYIQWLQQIDPNISEQYWNDYLAGYIEITSPPTPSKGELRTLRTSSICIEGKTLEQVITFCGNHACTQNTLMQAIWGYLLAAYNHTNDVVFGSVVSGRTPELEGIASMVGLFINTVPVRIRFDRDQDTPGSLVRSIQNQAAQSLEHHYLNLGDLQRTSDMQGTLFDHILVFENYPLENLMEVKDSAVELKLDSLTSFGETNYDFEIIISEGNQRLEVDFKYNEERYHSELIKRMQAQFEQLLRQFLEQPEKPLNQITVITEKELESLKAFGTGKKLPDSGHTLLSLFETTTQNHGGKDALVFADRHWTYTELDLISSKMASFLYHEQEVTSDCLVGISLENSDWFVIAILSILKMGAAYVPIDPELPESRKNTILNDVGGLCIDQPFIDLFKKNVEEITPISHLHKVDPNDLAYVIFTSGSTGKPKGVMINHGSVVNYYLAMVEAISIDECQTFALPTSLCADLGYTTLYGALLSGGCLHVMEKSATLNAALFQDYLEHHSIDCFKIVPEHWKALENVKLVPQKKLIFGGDVLSPAITEVIRKKFPDIELYNHYGPTEATIGGVLRKVDLEWIPGVIGTPLPNIQVYLMGPGESLTPINAIGEICLTGPGLARGYYQDRKLTSSKFITNPFGQGKMYRTGDLGRWTKKGELEFLGRADEQIKIRGYRVEIGEIASNLKTHSYVKDCKLISKDNKLVAYYLSEKPVDTDELRVFLEDRLPAHMLPHTYIELAHFPLTSNGKIDTRKLPAPDPEPASRKIIQPKNEQEQILVKVLKDVLQLSEVCLTDNFYAIGGDSIKCIQIVSRLHQHGWALRVEDMLRNPQIDAMARLVKVAERVVDQSEVVGESLLTPIQLSFFDLNHPTPNHYNQSMLLMSREKLETISIGKAWEAVVCHHDVLRSVFSLKGDSWKQSHRAINDSHFEVDYFDLSEAANPSDNIRKIGSKAQASLHLDGGLLKVLHFRLQDGDRLGIIIHHLIVDGVSWRILLEDLATAYEQVTTGTPVKLPLKTDSFQRWAFQLRKQVRNIGKSRTHWIRLAARQLPEFPIDIGERSSKIKQDKQKIFTLPRSIVETIQRESNRVCRADINDILLTSLSKAIHQTFQIEECMVRMESHGRTSLCEAVDISRTVGWFTSVFPHVLKYATNTSDIENIVQTKEAIRSIPENGLEYGLLKYFTSYLSGEFPYQIGYNFLGDFSNSFSGETADNRFEYASESLGSNIAEDHYDEGFLSVVGIIVEDGLRLTINYPSVHYLEATISAFCKNFKDAISSYALLLKDQEKTYLTPSDLTYKQLQWYEVLKLADRGELEDAYPLSPLQLGMYFHWQAEPSKTLYMEQMSYSLSAQDLSPELLEWAFQCLIDRHPVLRTSFRNDVGGTPLQIVYSTARGNFTFLRWSKQLEFDSKDTWLDEEKERDRMKGFDLENPSQMRLKVLDMGEGNFEFIWSHHHILMDGWCVGYLINDFYQILYHKLNQAELPPLANEPYVKYIQWIEKLDKSTSLRYWSDYLSDYGTIASLPKRKQQSYGEEVRQVSTSYYLKGKEYDRLDRYCRSLGITQNVLMQAAWGFLLARYNNAQDVVYGTVVSGRPGELHGVEQMIGLFINTIPMRVRYDPFEMTVEDLLHQVRDETIASTPHHYMSLAEVQSGNELGMELINHILTFENFPVQQLLFEEVNQVKDGLGMDLQVASVEVFEDNNYGLNIIILPSPGCLEILFRYDERLYDRETMTAIQNHFVRLIGNFIALPSSKLHKINFLSENELQKLRKLNDTHVDFGSGTVLDLFAKQAIASADDVAVAQEEKQFTYAQLDEISNQIAWYLATDHQIAKGDLVALHLENSPWAIAGILGIMKSGAAFMPVDTKYPEKRKAFLMEDSKCKACLDTNILADFISSQDKWNRTTYPVAVGASDTSYVIYTSGSTGQPKGVKIGHDSLYNYVSWGLSHYFAEGSNASFGLFTSLSFDLTISCVFFTILRGSMLRVFRQEDEIAETLNAYLTDHLGGIKLTPSHISIIEEEKVLGETNLQFAIVGGEALQSYHVDRLQKVAPGIPIYNEYGPTEATVGCTVFKVDNASDITIGTPIANSRVYVLSTDLALQPMGIVGEIYIGGDCLAQGYLNREELTKSRFIPNPHESDGMMYKTGDLGYWRDDGNLVYVGRADDQVKINGFRVELGEVEQQLGALPGVTEATLEMLEMEDGSHHLVAYFVQNQDLTPTALQLQLEERLPHYMIPHHWVELESFPLTKNGKVDKARLGEFADFGNKTTYVAPKTDLEIELVGVMEAVLGHQPIGLKDSFFSLGGDSIKSIQLAAKLKRKDLILKVQDILRAKDVQALAALIKKAERKIDQSTVTGRVQLTPIQRAFFDFELPHPEHYNQSIVLKSRKKLNHEVIRQCLTHLVTHHDALRMVFIEKDGVWSQTHQDNLEAAFSLTYEEISSSEDIYAKIEAVGNKIQSGIDLTKGPLLQVCHFAAEGADRVGLIVHHLIMDGISWRILLEDLAILYDQIDQGNDPGLQPKTDSFKYWSQQLQRYSDSLTAEAAFWTDNSWEVAPNKIQDIAASSKRFFYNNTQMLFLSEDMTERIQTQVHHALDTEINDVLLAGLGLALKDVFDINQSIVQMEGHGREEVIPEVDVNRTVGWFTSVYPFLLSVRSGQALEVLKHVRQALRKIPNKGFDHGVIKHLTDEKMPSHQASIEFNYLGDFGHQLTHSKKHHTIFEYADETLGANTNELNGYELPISVSGMIVAGRLRLSISYNTDDFEVDKMKQLTSAYEKYLKSLIDQLYSLSLKQRSKVTPPSAQVYGDSSTNCYLQNFFFSPQFDQSVILIPYIGAVEGIYRQMARELALHSNVYIANLPWRTYDLEEDHHQDLFEVLDLLLLEIKGEVTGEIIFYGHSSGTLIATWLSFKLRQNHQLKGLILGANFLLTETELQERVSSLNNMSDEEIWSYVSTGEEYLTNADAASRQQVLDNVKRETRLTHTLNATLLELLQSNYKLQVPVHTVYGDSDFHLENYESKYKSWNAVSDELEMTVIPKAHHLFISHNPIETSKILRNQIDKWKANELSISDKNTISEKIN